MEKSNLNLKLLLDNCLRGNRASQKRLYQHFYSFGLNLCMRYARNREEAKEMLNDGFLKVFQNLNKYDSQQAFQPWLRKVLIHSAIDYFRKFKRLPDFEELEEGNSGLTEYEAQDQLEYKDVLDAIQKLPPAYRMVFNLYVMEGYKHHEIATMLNVSTGTSKSNLARAKQKLQGMLRAEYREAR